MAAIKMAYIGGGSTRGAGHDGLVHPSGSRLRRLRGRADRPRPRTARADARPRRADGEARGLDLTVSATTDRRAGLEDCDAVLSSFRPGGFAARVLDERIPLKHGVIGQETQGPGGFFMALRAVHVLQGRARRHRGGLPEGQDLQLHEPGQHPRPGRHAALGRPVRLALRGADLLPRPDRASRPSSTTSSSTRMVGLNHACWSVRHQYDGADAMPLVAEDAWERRKDDPTLTRQVPPAAAHRGRDGRDPLRVLPVLLLPRRGARRAARPSRRRAPRTSWAGRPTTGRTTPSRPRATTRSSIPTARAAASTSSSSRST